MKNEKEGVLYPIVETWMKKNFLCFKTAINKEDYHLKASIKFMEPNHLLTPANQGHYRMRIFTSCSS